MEIFISNATIMVLSILYRCCFYYMYYIYIEKPPCPAATLRGEIESIL